MYETIVWGWFIVYNEGSQIIISNKYRTSFSENRKLVLQGLLKFCLASAGSRTLVAFLLYRISFSENRKKCWMVCLIFYLASAGARMCVTLPLGAIS